jgi:predicted Zn-dependent peptidase
MKRLKYTLAVLPLLLFIAAGYAQNDKKYFYESVEGDPLNARIYKLENGLTVYMSVYKNAPRIQTYIATRAGSKNDPTDATGLAHYLEHMLFKGTDVYGTKDFAKEKEQLDKIEALYEKYRKTRDEKSRKKIYHQIDSISGYASQFAIANEYDKMLSSIGAKGTNAYTWLEQTVYVNDIPSNQLENWMTIEAERFRNPQLRLFHTELEAVYEEKNRGLDDDGNKSWEALFEGLFPTNKYGSQTTIGTIEHLKNPSLTEIKKYFNSYYVPNNMAICLSGDLDPDATIRMIDQKFSKWRMKPVPEYTPYVEPPIKTPVVKEILGPDAESVMVGFRFAGMGSRDADMIQIINKILSNGKAGLFDIYLNQEQRVLNAGAYDMEFKDYSAHILMGQAKEGQSLEEVKKLLLAEVQKMKEGNFPDWLLDAIITDMKLQQTKMFESNSSRADAMVNAFITGTRWSDYVNTIARLSKITKGEIIDFVRTNYGDNHVVVYKRTGEDKSVQKVEKPAITPVEVNRNDQSSFVKTILQSKASEIEPVFIDYEKDILKGTLKNGVSVLYTANTENKTFDMYYVVDMGTDHNKKLDLAVNYLKYLGTGDKTAAQVQEEFYRLGCSFNVYVSEDQLWVSLTGLTENMEKATRLFEELLASPKLDEEALRNLKADILKKRADAKLNKNEILFSALANYGKYGKRSPYTNILSASELEAVRSQELIDIISSLNSYEHHILYYGNNPLDQVTAILSQVHKAPEKLKPVPAPVKYEELAEGNNVYVVDYDMKQAEIIMLAKDGKFDASMAPSVRLFNEYFGGGMSSIVFQDMRESKALAYSVWSNYRSPSKLSEPYYAFSYIGTQADKLPEAMDGMMALINKMPESESGFKAAKESIIQGIRTERITRSSILFNYESSRKLGLKHDIRKDVYTKVPALNFNDIRLFEEKHLKSRKYTVLVLGKKDGLDMKTLQKYGKVSFLTLEDIFGY